VQICACRLPCLHQSSIFPTTNFIISSVLHFRLDRFDRGCTANQCGHKVSSKKMGRQKGVGVIINLLNVCLFPWRVALHLVWGLSADIS
jgi:hypothetical protein